MGNVFQGAPASGPGEILTQQFPGGPEGVDFDRLYQIYGRRVYLWCARIVGDNAEAEDLTQDSFLHLFRIIHKFRGEASFSTWFHRVVINVALGQLRKKSIQTIPLDGPIDPGSEGCRPVEGISRLRVRTASPVERLNLERALTELPSAFRKILILHDVQGYRHGEIARILGVPIGTSKSYLHRARLRMRKLLASGWEGQFTRSGITKKARKFHPKSSGGFTWKSKMESRNAD